MMEYAKPKPKPLPIETQATSNVLSKRQQFKRLPVNRDVLRKIDVLHLGRRHLKTRAERQDYIHGKLTLPVFLNQDRPPMKFVAAADKPESVPPPSRLPEIAVGMYILYVMLRKAQNCTVV